MANTSSRRETYLVVLPRSGIGVSGYEEVSHVGETTATSGSKAVTQYLHRIFPKRARLVAYILSQGGRSLSDFAFKIPGGVNTQEELRNELARQMAERDGIRGPEFYYRLAEIHTAELIRAKGIR